MTPQEQTKRLAEQLVNGQLPIDTFVEQVQQLSVARLDDARVDIDRQRRCGFPEVVYGAGKLAASIEQIVTAQLKLGQPALVTRIDDQQAAHLVRAFPEGIHNEMGRTFRIGQLEAGSSAGRIAIVTAGTTDRPVAEEARETALWMGLQVTFIQDVGVAGPQRLLQCLPELTGMDCIVVVAGMEAALPSVLGGYVDCPVIAVPTSVGYGANLGGMTALLGMLNSCAANVTVVNIDAGFKGAYNAGLIATRVASAREG